MMLVASIFSFVWLFFVNKRLQMKWWEAVSISILSILFGAAGAIFHNYLENGFAWNSVGTSVFGAIFIAALVAYLGYLICNKRYSYLIVLDNIAVIVAIFMVLTRINCLKAGCCYGILIGDTGMRYPTRETDILVNVLFIIFAANDIFKGRYIGNHYFIYLIVYGSCRFIIEWFRFSDTNMPLHFGHIWSIAAVIIAAFYLILIKYVFKKGNKTNEKA